MKSIIMLRNFSLAMAIAGLVTTGAALAKKPDWAGGDHGNNQEQGNDRGDNGDDNDHGHGHGHDHGDKGSDHGRGSDHGGGDHVRYSGYFDDHRRTVVRDYYDRDYRGGNCPPGLAKKHNGCMPPGQAKKWEVGRPLPHDVVYYELPPRVVVELGPPPRGHKYVRVASDILLIAVATGMVEDAVNDLGR